MKILFICGSAEPGKDGVGDYTRRLTGELINNKNEVQILSLCDNHASRYISEQQIVENTTVLVNRIPVATSNDERFILVQEVLNKFQPEWISLQFVPYSFNPKGLPFWLPSFLKKLKGSQKWQIMIHELWIGMDVNTSIKHKIIGLFQQKIIAQLLKKIKPKVINTQTDLYQTKIAALGYRAEILPLCSNIIKNKDWNEKGATEKSELRFCIFGNIHHGAPVLNFITDLKDILSASEETVLKFIFIGNCGTAIEEWKEVLAANQIKFEITGFVTDTEISTHLSSCKYGISTTPYILSQKSGTLVAILEHQLPVLIVSRNWKVKDFHQKKIQNVLNYENKETVKEFLENNFIVANKNNLEFVASNFLNGLK